jgi:hypothetical protein
MGMIRPAETPGEWSAEIESVFSAPDTSDPVFSAQVLGTPYLIFRQVLGTPYLIFRQVLGTPYQIFGVRYGVPGTTIGRPIRIRFGGNGHQRKAPSALGSWHKTCIRIRFGGNGPSAACSREDRNLSGRSGKLWKNNHTRSARKALALHERTARPITYAIGCRNCRICPGLGDGRLAGEFLRLNSRGLGGWTRPG